MKSKNRTDKSSVVPAKEVTEKPATGAGAKKPEVVKPPKFSLDGNKWAVVSVVFFLKLFWSCF